MRTKSWTTAFVLGFALLTGSIAGAEPLTDTSNGLPDIAPGQSKDSDFIFVPLVNERANSEHTSGQAIRINATQSQQPDPAKTHRPRVVLALGGGGARGAAHVGVLRELIKAGIPIDGIAGTSIGAVVGGLFSAGVPLDDLEKRMKSASLMRAYIVIPVQLRVMVAPILSAPRLIGFHPYDGLYFGAIFHHYLKKALPAEHMQVEDTKIPFVAVATDLCDGHTYGIKKGDLVTAMQASSAVPELRKPVELQGKLFVDGGVLSNVPVRYARAMGGDIVIAVQVDERFCVKPPDTFRKVGSVASRMVALQLSALDSFHEREADIVIHPDVDGISLISTKKKDGRRAVTAGAAAVRSFLPEIKKRLTELGLTGLN